jgi:hypothetical protein
MQWLVIYTPDRGRTQERQTITAATRTKAFVLFCVHYNGIILEIKKI